MALLHFLFVVIMQTVTCAKPRFSADHNCFQFDMNFPHAPYELLPSIKNIFRHPLFFSTYIFIAHLFCGLVGACMNPGSFFKLSFVHSLVCSITCSFLNGFQPNLYQHFPHVCSTCHTILSLK